MFPEPISAVSFALGAISFLFTVRNGIEKIRNDVDTYKKWAEILNDTQREVDLLAVRGKNWEKLWRVNKSITDEGLFAEYWGADGSRQVQALLAEIHRDCKEMEAELKSISRGAFKDIDLTDSRQSGIAEAYGRGVTDLEAHGPLRKDFQESYNWRQRLSGVFLDDSILQKHLARLRHKVDTLESLSRLKFQETNRNYKEKDWSDYIGPISSRWHLPNLAKRSIAASERLGRECREEEAYEIDFLLNHDAPPSLREETLARYATYSSMDYHLFISARPDPTPPLHIRCREEKVHRLTGGPEIESFSNCVDMLMRPTADNKSTVYWKGREQSAQTFALRKEGHRTLISESLRSFLVSRKALKMRKNLLEFERFLLAYELAECALLFLKTNWFSELCSCSVRRREDESFRSLFVTRIGKVEHADPETGKIGPEKQWCEKELKNMHLHRLGVLLAEVAVGCPVKAALYNPQTREVEVHFDTDVEDTKEAEVQNARGSALRAYEKANEGFRDAVGYCLRQAVPPEDVAPEQVFLPGLTEFYDGVVKPLSRYYEDVVVQRYQKHEARLPKLSPDTT